MSVTETRLLRCCELLCDYVFSLAKLQVQLENIMLRGLCASSCLTFKHVSNFKHINSSIHFTGIILVHNFEYVLKWFSKLCSQKASEAAVTMNVMGQLENNCPVETSLFCVKTTRFILLQFKEKIPVSQDFSHPPM